MIAGLDAETRDLIDRMPANVRQEFIKALREGMPIIDNSVHSYLQHIDKIAADRIDQSRCAIIGSTKVILPEFKEVYLGITNKPIEDISEKYNDLSKIFRVKSEPKIYRLKYIEFIARAEHTGCQFNPNEKPWSYVKGFSNQASERFNLWDRLNNKCENAYDCYNKLYGEVKQFLNSSNQYDLITGNVNAMERFNSLPSPDKIKPSKLDIFSNSKILVLEFEQYLSKLLNIYNEVGINRALRIEKEKKESESDTKAVKIIEIAREKLIIQSKEAENLYTKRKNTLGDLKKIVSISKDIINKNNGLKLEMTTARELAVFKPTIENIDNFPSEINTKNIQIQNQINTINKEIELIKYEIDSRDTCRGPSCFNRY